MNLLESTSNTGEHKHAERINHPNNNQEFKNRNQDEHQMESHVQNNANRINDTNNNREQAKMKKIVKNKTNSTTQNKNNNINKDQITNQSQQTIPRPKPT